MAAKSVSSQIDAYLATLPEAMRNALDELRRTIATAAPDAQEAISYGAPAFKYRGRPLVSYGAAKLHGSLYVMSPAVMQAHADLVESYDTSKGTVRFPPEQPIPAETVTTLVRARMAETDAAAEAKRPVA